MAWKDFSLKKKQLSKIGKQALFTQDLPNSQKHYFSVPKWRQPSSELTSPHQSLFNHCNVSVNVALGSGLKLSSFLSLGQLPLSWNPIARTELVALQETGGTWCISSVLARHGCDLGQSMAVTSQSGQGLYLAQVSSQTLTAHGSVLLLCSKCSAKPRDHWSAQQSPGICPLQCTQSPTSCSVHEP